jgi:hypothetical protein
LGLSVLDAAEQRSNDARSTEVDYGKTSLVE